MFLENTGGDYSKPTPMQAGSCERPSQCLHPHSFVSEGDTMASSRTATPFVAHDEDSMMSSPPGGPHRDDRSELLKVLDEVSSSSDDEDGEEGDSEEEELQIGEELCVCVCVCV